MYVVTVEEMRRLEQQAEAAGTSADELMERAGLAVGVAARGLLGGCAGRRIVVLAGPGNNGGDGLVAARLLARWGAAVTVVVPVERRQADGLAASAADYGCTVLTAASGLDTGTLAALLSRADLIIDALLGTGRRRPLEGPVTSALSAARQAKAPVLAVDLPTGVDADTGAVDPKTLPAEMTVVLGAPKRGMFWPDAHRACGRLTLAGIGLPDDAGSAVRLVDSGLVRAALPGRPLDGHKGTFGRVVVIGGSRNYIGAPALAGRGAARAGAGLVTLATPARIAGRVAAMMPEATHLPLRGRGHPEDAGIDESLTLPEAARDADAVLLGPGLGLGEGARALVQGFFQRPHASRYPPLVLDADALNILAGRPEWWRGLPLPAVVTPHPGEMARLMGTSVPEVQADRIEATRSAAARWGLTVVLKGAFTVVADQDGRVALSPWALSVLGSAGTGDVLAGALAGLLAQGAPPFEAACAAVYLHASAGLLAATDLRVRETGVLAGDVADRLPAALDTVCRGDRVEGAFA